MSSEPTFKPNLPLPIQTVDMSAKEDNSIKSLYDKSHLIFIVLSGLFITNVLIAEFVGIKVFSLERTLGFDPINAQLYGFEFSLNMTAGVLLWPIVFIMTDIINEYYGRRGVKLLSYIAVIMITYAFIVILFSIQLTPADNWVKREIHEGIEMNMNLAFREIFGQGLWIIFGSLFAFIVGQLLDISLFHWIKTRTGEGWLWLRSTGSTLISQLIDSFIVLFISFHINPSLNWDIQIIIVMWLVKYSYKAIMAILLTPVIYLVHYWIDQYLGEELAEKLKRQAMENN